MGNKHKEVIKESEKVDFAVLMKTTLDKIKSLKGFVVLSKDKEEQELKTDELIQLTNGLTNHFFSQEFRDQLELEFFNNPQKTQESLKKIILFLEETLCIINRHAEVIEPTNKLKEEIKKLEVTGYIIIRQLRRYVPEFRERYNGYKNPFKKPKNITPFNTSKQENVFNYLDKNWLNSKPIKYAYIYRYMVDELDMKIDFTTYNKFILSKHGKKVQRNNASSNKPYEQIREIMTEYNH